MRIDEKGFEDRNLREVVIPWICAVRGYGGIGNRLSLFSEFVCEDFGGEEDFYHGQAGGKAGGTAGGEG